MSLWGYVGQFDRDTEFGGKTGTSNNHSDAWYVGVTPKLVAGGWVGGEYRSIHFRTGQLGQGSRTALPIFGKFMAKVLADKRFSKYCVPFAPPSSEIRREEYECASAYSDPVPTLDFDSIVPMEGVSFDNQPVELGESESDPVPESVPEVVEEPVVD